jgi:hypothetical protein
MEVCVLFRELLGVKKYEVLTFGLGADEEHGGYIERSSKINIISSQKQISITQISSTMSKALHFTTGAKGADHFDSQLAQEMMGPLVIFLQRHRF